MSKKHVVEPAYLSSTAIGVLKLMASDLTSEFTIRKIAQGIKQDYKITYVTVNRLAEAGVVKLERKANLRMCHLNLQGNQQVLAFIESLRLEEFLKSKPAIHLQLSTIVTKITNVLPFFCLILFGSVVKGKAVSRSDLDMLLILPEKTFQSAVENELTSVTRTSTAGIHEIILSSDQFASMLSEAQRANKPNVATEVLKNHIVPYGAEVFYRLVSRVMP